MEEDNSNDEHEVAGDENETTLRGNSNEGEQFPEWPVKEELWLDSDEEDGAAPSTCDPPETESDFSYTKEPVSYTHLTLPTNREV